MQADRNFLIEGADQMYEIALVAEPIVDRLVKKAERHGSHR